MNGCLTAHSVCRYPAVSLNGWLALYGVQGDPALPVKGCLTAHGVCRCPAG